MTHNAIVHVNLAPSPYDVIVAADLLRSVGQSVAAITRSHKVALVTDTNLQRTHLPRVVASLQSAGFEVLTCILPAGEEHKTIASITRIYDTFLPAGIDRNTPLLALGGGVIGDMTGFAAATMLRGVPFIQVPTTLLCMVDASVGGKTGIDHPCGKNLIGAFHQPRAVLIDPEVLLSLPDRELIGGLAECIKHDIIRDAEHLALLPDIIARSIGRDVATLTDLIVHNVAIKARVVEADPFEQGERAHLNFGHTFAHAFEKVSHFGYSHGEAVGLGLIAAARLAEYLGMLNESAAAQIKNVIATAGLPVSGLTLDPQACLEAMAYDKKNAGARIRFVLLDAIGHVVIRDDVPPKLILQAIASLAEAPL